MKITELLITESARAQQGPVGHWDPQQHKWVGFRYSGYLPDHVPVGNLTLEQHLAVHFPDPQQAQLIRDQIHSPGYAKIIELAMNGYTSEMIADEMYDPQQLETQWSKVLTSISARLSQARKQLGIPIPPAAKSRADSILNQALELKQRMYRSDDRKANSDAKVAHILSPHTGARYESIVSQISRYRKYMINQGQTLPDWLKDTSLTGGKDRPLKESIAVAQGLMGHWDQQQRKWVGLRYSGYLPDTFKLGRMTFEQHIEHLMPRDQAEQILTAVTAEHYRKVIEMALNGYPSEMIAHELYDPQRVENELPQLLKSINVQLSHARRTWKIPVPASLPVKIDSALNQALELKKRMYRANQPHANSDARVGQHLESHGVSNQQKIKVLLSGHRKQMRDHGIPIPAWLKPAPSRQ